MDFRATGFYPVGSRFESWHVYQFFLENTMNTEKAKQKALSLMEDHGLTDWSFKFDRSLRRFGLCSFGKKTISLSRPLTELNEEPQVTDTILHEIAHVLAGPEAGHGPQWKRVAREIGATPKACYTFENVTHPKTRYYLECPSCGLKYNRVKKPSTKKSFACTKCCKEKSFGRYDDRFRLVVKERI